MEALNEILGAMKLSGAVILEAEFSAPWCVRSKIDPDDCRPFTRVPEQIIAYHYVLEGGLVLKLGDGEPIEATRNDLVIVSRNEPHVLGSAVDLAPADANDLIEQATDGGPARIRHGGGGARTRILCGFLGSSDANNPLLQSLPSVLKLSVNAERLGSFIESSMRYAMLELSSGGAESSASLARLAELLFGESIREYVRRQPPGTDDWLAGLSDPYVGRALALLHRRFDHPWTLEALAREVGLSRSALSDRFVQYLKVSPMRYLGRRRLEEAAARLRTSRKSVAEIAAEVGYDSEAAFSRSFKRAFGVAPAGYRQMHASG
ncbi:MAG: AraC family transcriptional regulator [Pseudomonadota bacterium]